MTIPSPLLKAGELERALQTLPGWRVDEGRLHRQLRFPDFATAFRFLCAVAALAEARQHHPEWRNRYDQVWIWLSTHDAGGITQLDVDLARAISASATGAVRSRGPA